MKKNIFDEIVVPAEFLFRKPKKECELSGEHIWEETDDCYYSTLFDDGAHITVFKCINCGKYHDKFTGYHCAKCDKKIKIALNYEKTFTYFPSEAVCECKKHEWSALGATKQNKYCVTNELKCKWCDSYFYYDIQDYTPWQDFSAFIIKNLSNGKIHYAYQRKIEIFIQKMIEKETNVLKGFKETYIPRKKRIKK